ncbi:putative secreted protein [Proteiniphilum saccharofermentans]|jgi:hypothetical protein|uniref:Putative secreted protein n=1 Tax=Proteiniphilum saccharofermentans TaxID=1642647 RepID=A0A1R3TDF8_9BACT|nr:MULTISPECIES: porin family protein [Proteiniphilum]MDY9918037.1 porin family protein [Proteiniphilum sp.]SCD22035.1 putative secreted protein [Proteiniphilum saccharofermentans]SDZ93700.1 Outer membrane protein beta-barrel domain-containing protein [Porphyromonadaceae bacterium KH3R12]SFS62812.1 Outer membrane protein beta-barrel domain-containing protein [Porphyromonadaceae bacterium NLAE-zl-C104]
MKTKTLFLSALAAFLLIGATANAQLRFGLRGEVGLNKPSFSEEVFEVENLNSFKIGPTAEFMLPVVNLGVEGAILYSNDRMNVKDVSEEGAQSIVQKVSNHYLDVPVNLKYKIGFLLPVKAYLAGGPYARFLIASDDFTWETIKGEVEAKSFEAGVNLGLGAELFSRLAVGVNYGIRMTDNYSVDKPEWTDAFNGKKGTWSLTAAVYF